MFTDLKNYDPQEYFLTPLDKKEFQIQRQKYGISDIDLEVFTEYLDEVIYNGLSKIIFSTECSAPKFLTKEEWNLKLERALQCAKNIHDNNVEEMSTGLPNFNSKEDYMSHINNLNAESYVLRDELFKFLNEYHDYIFI